VGTSLNVRPVVNDPLCDPSVRHAKPGEAGCQSLGELVLQLGPNLKASLASGATDRTRRRTASAMSLTVGQSGDVTVDRPLSHIACAG